MGFRSRKIRCDETWPVCENCIKASRQCERGPKPHSGSTAPWKFKTPLTLSHFRPSKSVEGIGSQDIVYLDAFRCLFIDGIVGQVSRPAWKQLIIQALHQEPAFRHAAIAFGAAYGLPEETDKQLATTAKPVTSAPVPSKTLALHHYNQCIKGLQSIIRREDSASINSTLLCTLLCICFELRINKPDIALSHLEHGLRVLESTPETVDTDLLLAFTKLDIQASIFLGHRPPKTNMHRLPSLILGSRHEYPEMDKALTYLLGKIFIFIRTKADPFRYHREGPLPPSLYAQVEALEVELQQFRSNYLSPEAPDPSGVIKLPVQEQVLWINYLILRILLSTCLCIDEMIYDRFFPDFITIITMAEPIINSQKSGARNYKDFNLNMAVLYPLFKIAQVCRSPFIRRKCIGLMANVSFNEGVWDGSSGQEYAGLLMRLEEDGMSLDESNLVGLGPSVIPEWRRIRSLDVQPEAEEIYSTLFFRFDKATGQWNDLVKGVTWGFSKATD